MLKTIGPVDIYYSKYLSESINEQVRKKIHEQADKIADEVIASFDIKQQITETLDGRIILTTILERKEES